MRRAIFLGGILVLGLMVGPASAVVTLDFGTGGAGAMGSLSISGGQAVGVGIPVDQLTVVGTVGHDGVYDLFGTLATGDSNGSARLDFNTGTGAFTIVGGVCPVNPGGDNCSSGSAIVAGGTTLVNGTGASATILLLTSGSSAGSVVLTERDTKATALLTALGLPSNITFQLMNASIQGTNTAGTGSPYTVTSTDVQNQGTVPEPTSIVLFGTALLGVAQLLRRRARN